MVKPSSSHGETLNVVTRGKYKVVLKVSNSPKNASSSKQVATPSLSSYYLVNQLQRTTTRISIFELELSPLHKEILKKSLRIANVHTRIDVEWFQAMVNHISSPHYLTFFEEDE